MLWIIAKAVSWPLGVSVACHLLPSISYLKINPTVSLDIHHATWNPKMKITARIKYVNRVRISAVELYDGGYQSRNNVRDRRR